MLKLRMKANGRESLVIGLTPVKLAELLADGLMLIEGTSFGLDDKMIVIMVGPSSKEMMQRLEENLPVRFPRDESGNYISVNS